jgi:hypothetical protein
MLRAERTERLSTNAKKRRLAMGNRDRQKREQKKPKQPKKPAPPIPPIRAGQA